MPSAWKLTVTILGAPDGAREVVVHGDNWLSALREGQRQLGEPDGVPPGASCAVAATGLVTVLDPVARRRYVLEPQKPSPAGATGGAASVRPAAPSQPAPALQPPPGGGTSGSVSARPPSVRPPQAAPTSDAASASGSARERALPSDPGARGSSAAPPAMVSELDESARGDRDAQRWPKPTLDYSPERAEALRREYEGARARASFPSLAGDPAGHAAVGSPPSARPSSRPPSAPTALSLDPFAPAVAPPRPEGRRASLPPPAVALRSPSQVRDAVARPTDHAPPGPASDGLSLLSTRDMDPTPSSPLTYRERAYLLHGKADRVRLEVLLQAELAQVRRELAAKPRGQFVRLGVFSEAFAGAPEQPPLATLEWKDWRGRAVFRLASDDEELAPPASDPPSAAPITAPRDSGLRPSVPEEPVAFDEDGWPSPATVAARSSAPPPPAGAMERMADGFEERTSEPDLRLASAFESMPELHLLGTPVRGLEFTVDLLSRLVPCDAVSACLYDINTDEFRFVALSGRGAAERKASAVRASAGLFGAARRERGDVLLTTSSDARFDDGVDGRSGLHAQSLAYVPVRHRGQLLGMLQLINRDLPGGFAQSDVGVLTYVAAQLGEFLANCWAGTD